MIIFIFFAIVIFFYIFLKFYRKKNFLKNKKNVAFDKNNLNKWMNLTKKERYNLSKKDSASYLNKRKVLLEKIRKEYKIISKGNEKNLDI